MVGSNNRAIATSETNVGNGNLPLPLNCVIFICVFVYISNPLMTCYFPVDPGFAIERCVSSFAWLSPVNVSHIPQRSKAHKYAQLDFPIIHVGYKNELQELTTSGGTLPSSIRLVHFPKPTETCAASGKGDHPLAAQGSKLSKCLHIRSCFLSNLQKISA